MIELFDCLLLSENTDHLLALFFRTGDDLNLAWTSELRKLGYPFGDRGGFQDISLIRYEHLLESRVGSNKRVPETQAVYVA